MSTNKGWIKLYRDITEHWVYQDPLLLKMWITLLCKANHEDKKLSIKNELISIRRGQFWTSIRKLSDFTQMTRKTVEIKLNVLQSDGMIYVDSKRCLGTLITICNYGVYQNIFDDDRDTDGDTYGDTHGDNAETLRGTKNAHKQETKNLRMNKEREEYSGLPPDDPDYFEEV